MLGSFDTCRQVTHICLHQSNQCLPFLQHINTPIFDIGHSRSRCSCWCRGTIISHEISDRKVRFMTYTTNDGDTRTSNCTCNHLVIKSPEFFNRPSATSHNRYIGLTMFIEQVKGSSNRGWSISSLNLGRLENNSYYMIAHNKHSPHIPPYLPPTQNHTP